MLNLSRVVGLIWKGFLLGVPMLAHGAEIKVDSLNDAGAGSLRSAIAGAADGDVVLLRAEGTLTLVTPITVNRDITIKGQNGPLLHTISGGGLGRMFVIPAGRTVTVAGLTLSSGRTAEDGGAIHSQGRLTLENLRLMGNEAGGQGGAVYQQGGILSVSGVHFAENVAAEDGGALAVEGASLLVSGSGFTGNRAGGAGGGLSYRGSQATLRNTTLAENEALTSGGGASLHSGAIDLVNLTVLENAAGDGLQVAVAASATARVGNSIIAGAGGFASAGGAGSVISLGHNLSDGPASVWNAATDQSATPTGLGAAGDYGGVSPTYVLEPGSAAIDAGDNALASGRDQRGLARVSDGDGNGGDRVDIGAFEVQLYRVSALQMRGSATGGEDDAGYGNPFDPSDDAGSIASADVFALLTQTGRADIGDAVGANNAAGGGAIAFSDAILPGRIFLKGSELEVRRNVSIYGPGADLLVVDGDRRSRVLRVYGGALAYLHGFAIENGLAGQGGGILVEDGARLEMEAMSLKSNEASGGGGAIAVASGSVNVFRSALVGNRTAGSGGALATSAATVAVVDTTTVSGNHAGLPGGALAVAGRLRLESSTLAGNTSGGGAPGLFVGSTGEGFLRNSIFSHGGIRGVSAASAATVVSLGHNISDASELLLTAPSDLAPADPKLGPLSLNGGTTLSHAPAPDAPAINAGDNADAPSFDQPGFTRIRGGRIDIGSVEFQNDLPAVDCPLPASVECVGPEGATVSIPVSVGDPDGDALVVSWSLDGAPVATEMLAGGSSIPVTLSRDFALPIGDFTVRVEATDIYGQTAFCDVPVSVRDSKAPEVTLTGDAVVYLECGDSYTDAGASASDLCDPTVTATVFASDLPASGVVSTGSYQITYSATDASGNTGSATRTIVVTDTLAPLVTLNGPASVVLECGVDSWIDAGATAEDICSGSLPVMVSVIEDGIETGAVDTSMPGVYSIFYTAVDASGNVGSAVRTVEVRDTIAPTITAPVDMVALTDPGFCSATLSFAAIASDNCAQAPQVTYQIVPNEAYPDGATISSPFAFAPGVHVVDCIATDASGNSSTASFSVTVTDDYLNCINNTSWPNALPLELVDNGSNNAAQVQQFLALTDQARWYRFSVQPGSRVTVVLSELPANYDIVLYRDIAAEYARILDLFNSPDPRAQELALLGVEFAPESFSPESFSPESFSPESFSPESFSPESFSPESFSPESFSPESFSPESFSPESFSPESFSPESFSPESFSPESFSPESFSPESFSPESFSPESFSSAQMASMIGYSAFPGVANEGISINTFTRSGDFYVRVRGSNGAFSRGAPFKVNVVVEAEICEGVSGPETFGGATLVPTAGNYRSIIVWDSTRIAGTPSEISSLAQQLTLLAAAPEVQGVVVDVSLEGRVLAANEQADALPSCPYAKNLVASEIKAVIDGYRALNPDLEYVVILGNDDAIPFFRVQDEAFLANEANYIPPVIDNTHSQSSLRFGQMLTQDPYGAACEINLVTGAFPYPGAAVGRLVESAAEVSAQIANYLRLNGGVLPVPSTALVTGYDFLDDGARAVESEFLGALGGPVSTLIAASTLSPSEGWSATDLANALLTGRHDLVFLAGHFSTGSTLAADYETRLTAAQVLASGADFLNTLIFSAGCHSGYNTVDAHAINGITKQPDWSQAFARMGAIYIAGTGYQYGDTEFVEYGERLYLEFARELRTGSGPVAIGHALNQAKRRYLAETPLMRGIHEKTLVQATLFGLPMVKMDVPGTRLAPQTRGTDLNLAPADVAGNPGLTLGLSTADISVSPQLTPRSLDLTNIEDGSTVTARWFEGRDGIVTNPAEPARPLEVYLVSADNTLLRGAGFRGGRYSEVSDFLPLTGAPTTEIRGVYGNFFSEVFYPIQPYSLNYLGLVCGGTDGETRLNVYPTQFLATGGGVLGGTLRSYETMDFRLFYSDNREVYDATGVPSIPALAAPPSIAKVSSDVGADGASVDFNIRVLGNPAAGIQEVWVTYTGVAGSVFHGEWVSLDLSQDPDDSTLWTGNLPLAGALPDELRFMVQAASGTGLVSLSTNLGRYYEVGIDELAARTPTKIELIDPPSDGAYGDLLAVRARLTVDDGSGAPLAGVRVGFRVGNSKIGGFTDAEGIASVLVPLNTRPANQLLQAYFQGDREYAPSAAGSSVLVVKQATSLIFEPLPPVIFGRDVVVALADGNGTPLKERTVFFLVDYGSFQLGNAVITDFSGRADLSELVLPGGNVTITAFFNGTIPIPGSVPVTISDDLYLPSVASINVALADPEPSPEDSLAFDTRLVDVYYKSSGGGGRNASAPVYTNASIHGDVAFAVPLQPQQLLASPDAPYITATVEAWLAGQLIASETVQLDTRGNFGQTWTTARRPGQEVSYVGIHWSNAPRFDSSLSSSPGPRIYTNYIGNRFSEIVYVPVTGSYQTVFPDGTTIAVRNGRIDLGASSGLIAGDFTIDEDGVLTLAAGFGVKPGMVFTTRARSGGSIIAAVTVTDGVNYLEEGGRMIIRLAAIAGKVYPSSAAQPNLFEFRFVLGSGPGETEVRSSGRVGEGTNALPWSSDDPIHKQYRP